MTGGKVLLVTGGSRGIGAAVAIGAARAGWKVAVNYRANAHAAAKVVDVIGQEGGEAFVVEGDVGKELDILAMFAAVDARWGRLDGLVNNAGIVGPKARVEELSAERIETMLRINVTGSMLCAREAVKRMSSRRGGQGGVIVNLSSVAAKLGSPNEYVDYAASKAAIDAFTRGLGLEVADEGIRVMAVRPGIIDTEIHASGGQPDRIERVRGMVPMKREGRAEEVADLILYLLSDRASYMTASHVDVGGGR